MNEKRYTKAQQQVIDIRGRDILVSASAGTGKTTVMIERIAKLLAEGADISEIVVVTFTNLAAAEMKNRLSAKLAAKRDDKHIIDQLERIDSAAICTLHAFCSELLRSYFYVADIDPSYSILDTNLIAALRKSAMDEVFLQYYAENDEVFKKVYKIFAKARQQSNFVSVLYQLYDFSRCISDFNGWYQAKRRNMSDFNGGNPVIEALLDNIRQNVKYFANAMEQLRQRGESAGLTFADVFAANATILNSVRLDTLQNAFNDLYVLKLNSVPARNKNKDFGAVDKLVEEQIRFDYDAVKKSLERFVNKYVELSRGLDVTTLCEQTSQTVEYLDKLVEIITRFDKIYFELKKERGGVDFNDLEHLTLQVLNDDEALRSIRSKYKLIFVDEYQDTNPVQEAIISRLATHGNLFMVGDVKQSIYGFRGCEPAIFADKQSLFERQDVGKVIKLNDNFRSNVEILDYVNQVFNVIMTKQFGKVDYASEAQLDGSTPPALTSAPSVRIDFVAPLSREKREITDVYDITADTDDNTSNRQGELIIRRIKQYVGKKYVDKDGQVKQIDYGDIVILFRTLQGKALNIYNALIEANIPVVAGFNVDGYASKEIKDLINLMRVLDNPYNDIYLVGVCLSCFGSLSESELGSVRLDTAGRVPFYDRLKEYVATAPNAAIADKISKLLKLLDELRFYARSASVSEIALKTLQLTDYQLYVQGLPNCGLRLRKLYNFIDSVKDVSYGQSIDRFLSYIDEAEENALDSNVGASNAVCMMTMHASKGLEFPVVIIADMEHGFHKDTDAINCNFDMGIAMKYYDFDSMTYAPTLATAAYSMLNAVKQREEEMRLLYVAMTRAKFVLNLVATATAEQINGIAKLPQNANSHLDWILAANKTANLDKVSVNLYDDDWYFDDAEVKPAAQMCAQQTDKQAVLDRLNYRYPYAEQADMPSKVVSSALDKAYIDVHDQPEATFTQDDDRNFVGTAYHKVYQYVDYSANREQIAQTIQALVADDKIEQRFADKLDIDLIYNTLRNPQLVKLMSSGDVHHELPFMLYAPYNQVAKDGKYTDEVMLQGVIDLLVIADDKATVVDFKYTSRSDKVKDNYAAQLNSYKLAVQQICGISNVETYVLSIADNKLIKF